MTEKPRFVMCICTGQCPGFQGLDLWELINRVRSDLDVEYAIVHPQLCLEDGDRFWADYAKADAKYIVGACDPKMQRKLFKGAFTSVGGDLERQVILLDLRNMSTVDAFNKVAQAVKEMEPAAA
jgi:heterodisulfide reductase subunit A-like polyferredoxin